VTSSPPVQSEIGRPRPREETRRLLAGRGSYTDDVDWPGQLHAAFLRSPYPHATIAAIDTAEAEAMPGVAAVLTWDKLATVCKPWQTVSLAFPGLRSPVQHPLANGRAAYQGEPVALVLAASRALAEDAIEAIAVDWEEQPAATDLATALDPDAPLVHPELTSNLAWQYERASGDVDALFARAAAVVSTRLRFTRHTGVPLEPRSVMARFDPDAGILDVRMSHQMPHQMQLHLASFLDLPMARVRVHAPHVGGGFGIKMHVYQDEIAVCAAARLLGRPVKFVADRIESMISDVHAREHEVDARMAVDADGRILAFDIHDLHGLGAYSVYPRSSTMETLSALRAIGASYRFDGYRARADIVLQNKTPTGQYRSVGHPIACTVTERLVDLAATKLGIEPLEMRRRNYVRIEDMPMVNAAGAHVFDLSHHACLERLTTLIDLPTLRAEIDAACATGRLLGLGFAAFVEFTASGSEVYGSARVPVAASDTVVVTLEPDGSVRADASVSEIGQGITQGLAQVLADAIGVPVARVQVQAGDTGRTPHGGGAWSSRGAAIGGEAAWQAGLRLREEILKAAASLLQADPDALDIRDGVITDRVGAARMDLAAFAETVVFRGHELPPGASPQLTVAHTYRRPQDSAIPVNGIQAALVEVDAETGLVRCLRHWAVEDCGRILNPLLVDGQIRGGIVQGIGEALYEACRYDPSGQFVTGTLADYLLPMAGEMPDITIAHVETPYSGSALGAKGAGESGTCAAGAAILNAVNDALARHGGSVDTLPITPMAVLAALGRRVAEAA